MRGLYKLYLWEDVLVDYTSGVVFAIALNEEHGREIIKQASENYEWSVLSQDHAFIKSPKVIDGPFGFILWGGS